MFESRRQACLNGILANALMFMVVAIFASTSATAAEKAKFEPAIVETLDAKVMFEALPNTVLKVGDNLILTPRKNEAARRQYARPFQLRVFRVTGQPAVPFWLAQFDPCFVYLGRVFSFAGGIGTEEFNLGKLDDIGWLTLVKDKAAEKGRFLLVAEPLDKRNNIVRINVVALSTYFGQGIYFEVESKVLVDAKQVNDKLAASRKALADIKDEIDKNDASVDCIRTAEVSSPDSLGVVVDAAGCINENANEISENG